MSTRASGSPKKKFDPAQAGAEALEHIEAAVSELEEQVRDVNARIDKRAGRPLWQAIVFGLLLGGVFVASLFWLVELFVLFVTVLVVFAVLELAGALTDKGRLRSRWPLVVVSAAMVPLAALYGPEGQLWGLVGAIAIAVALRAGRALLQPDSRSTTLSDIGVAVMVLAYVPFLGGFAPGECGGCLPASSLSRAWMLPPMPPVSVWARLLLLRRFRRRRPGKGLPGHSLPPWLPECSWEH